MEKPRSIQKVVRKINLYEAETDFAYWQTQSPEARLAALEEIRQAYNRWKYGTESGLQRVVTIIHLDNLRKSKRASGRLQDLADLENLK